MAPYTEDDVQNVLVDFQNGVALATAATQNGVLRSTLRDRGNGTQSHRYAHEDLQRLSTVQEEYLECWILQQEALGYILIYI